MTALEKYAAKKRLTEHLVQALMLGKKAPSQLRGELAGGAAGGLAGLVAARGSGGAGKAMAGSLGALVGASAGKGVQVARRQAYHNEALGRGLLAGGGLTTAALAAALTRKG
jgi:hypothetical protein